MRGNKPLPLTPAQLEVFKAKLAEGWGPSYAAGLAGISIALSNRYRRDYPEFKAAWDSHLRKDNYKSTIISRSVQYDMET